MDNIRNMEYRYLPCMAMRGVVVFPHMMLNFDVGRKKSHMALEQAMETDQTLFLVAQTDPKVEDPEVSDLYSVGTIVKIKQVVKLPGETERVLVEGVCRARICNITDGDCFMCEVEKIDDIALDAAAADAVVRRVKDAFENYFTLNSKINSESMVSIMSISQVSELIDVIAANIGVKFEQKQELLEAKNIVDRAAKLIAILRNETEIIDIEQVISKKVKKQIDENQKEYYLREQLKAISDELGEKDGSKGEMAEYKKKIDVLKAPEIVVDKLNKELARLSKLPFGTPESGVIRTYLDTVLELPWSKKTRDRYDLKKAGEILENDHYGLKDVKERVLEQLAVRKMTKGKQSAILCLVGPPGVGKTSVAKSIASCLGRKYVRISLGGVRDEADIRGHRKTYIGAMPGRIIAAINQAGTSNPLMLFDEIDKIGTDYRSDPSSALLEVLDSEQNFAFRDHYLELDFDLSDVMFITTANTLETIPAPLLDRMEIISVNGYTDAEKLNIAKKYLVPKQKKKHGLSDKQLVISDDILNKIIGSYTREAGVRALEREIGKICRKAVKYIFEKDKKTVKMTAKLLEEFLGKEKFFFDKANEKDDIGIARGLAWTSVGGDTLEIEVNVMPGSGKIELTGQLGDVMKESAVTAISYIRSKADELGIPAEFYSSLDIHVHVPEGAVPKDGPSAGITMATAIISALSGKYIRSDVAMTGEVTLRGRVLPIGGLKEKSFAAYKAGIKTVIIPKDNKKDLDEVDDEVKANIKFVPVSSMDEVLKIALSGKSKPDFKLPISDKADESCIYGIRQGEFTSDGAIQ